MSKIIVNTDLDTAIAVTSKKAIKEDLKQARIDRLVFYMEKIIQDHFNRPNPNKKYHYTPNTKKYELWKRKHGHSIYQMVLSGYLKECVMNGKIDKRTNDIIFDIPKYGIYQLRAGRNFLDPNEADLKKMEKEFWKSFRRNREVRIRKNNKKR